MLGFDDEFDKIDRLIEDIQSRLETCEKAETLSRAVIVAAVGVLVLVVTIAGTYRTPVVVFSAVTAMLAGMVWLGANRSTRAELEDERAALDARKASLIDRVAARNGWPDRTPTVH